MLIRCCQCKDFIGEKEPFNDLSVTDTYCKNCFEKEMKKIDTFKKELERKNAINL